jgi:transposase, IS5 family
MHSAAWRHQSLQRQAYERSAEFKQGQRFRAGIEGRTGADERSRHEALPGRRRRALALFVGAAVLTNNLMIVAALLTKRSARGRKATPVNDPIVVALE